MAKKANDYMAVVDTWRPEAGQFKEVFDEYKRWVGAPNGTEWTGRTSNAAYDTASTDCHSSDNTNDTAEDAGKLVAATIEYEVVDPLVNGQRLIERVLEHKDRGVSIDQQYHVEYHPAEGESDESIARNREHVADIERQIKEYVAKWEQGCQTLKAQADAAAQKITGCVNPKTALVDGRKILRDAVNPTPGEGLSTATAASGKPRGIVEGIQDIAGAGDTKPASTAAVADYKEWYPKTPGAGDKLTIDPSKAGSLTGTIGALDKMPGAPKPADGFGSGVAKQFLKGANERVDGTIDEVKSKAGLNGADKFTESWTNSAKGLEHQIERTLFPGAAMAEDAKNVIDQAVTSYQHPEKIPENIGKTTVDAAIAGTTVPLGGEGAFGRIGLEDASIAGRGGLPDTPGLPHDAPPAGHTSVDPPTAHPAPSADHAPAVDHPAPAVDHTPPPVPHQPPAPQQFDPTGGQHYASGDPHHPGGWPPGTPEATWSKGDTEPGWKYINHNVDKDWMPYQQQIGGLERTPTGALPEWVQPNPDTGTPVDFDGHTYRGPQEVFLEAKDGYRGMAFAPDNSYWQGRADKAIIQVQRQLAALPPDARLEWHVSDPYGASALRQLFADRFIYDVDVIYTPKAP
ncbi:Tox-REase-5 domain-containing protein [Mycobacteroides abscessus]|uniref:Tox-REase-5 domain-containing protein n=1 Tax=Mycobacteroides abscessus TaxID=36809 RepID=UPI0009AB5D85|nr:Tox-REase-5 domain-containing protein [Mycobacteroides abscessus]